MAIELERVLYETESFLRRHIRSRSVREAQKRRAKRKFAEFVARLKRALYLLAGLLLALVGTSIVIHVSFLTWLVAIPTVFIVALASMFMPTRRLREAAEAAPQVPLADLAGRVEDGLVDRYSELPGRALPAADAILARLDEIRPHLAELDPATPLAGDARRLIGQHLPSLVDSYLELPPSARGAASEASRRFGESLNIVGEELNRLLDECCRDRHLTFETQRRFIETRYKDESGLSGG